jgi:hypothetical protein
VEWVAAGLTQLVLAALAVAGLVMVDATARQVNWSQPGTWIWLGAWALLGLAGWAMLWRARRLRPSSRNP